MNEVENKRAEDAPAPDFAGATQPSYARTLFFGPDGLRPGWGVVFYVAMYYPLEAAAAEFAWAHNRGASGLWSTLLETFGVLLAAVIPSLILARVERRPSLHSWNAYGLPLGRAFGKLFWIGVVWGFGAVSLLLLALRGLHVFDFGHLALHGARIAKFAVFWATVFLFVGLSEEFRFRGYPQFALGRGIGFWRSAVFLSAVFGMLHRGNQGEDWIGVLGAVVIGLFFCFTLRRTGNLWFAAGFHTAWDWGQTFFYSVPDSGMVWPGHLLRSSLKGPPWLTGGTVGPEGSPLFFALLVLVWIAFDRAYPKALVADRDV